MAAPADPENARGSHHRHGEVDSGHARDFAARQHPEDGRQRMHLNPSAEDARRDDVILQAAPDASETAAPSPVAVVQSKADGQNQRGSHQRADKRNELQQAAQRSQRP